jgi:CubicO group peptidase (beta-lactamase class C family)
MPDLPTAEPRAIGIDPARLRRAHALLRHWVETDRIPAAALCIGRRGRMLEPLLVGRQRPDPRGAVLRPDALFLVASITKPVTVTAAMILVERGQLALSDRVADFLPRFSGRGKRDVLIRHLMTHTSGLPDMLPSNGRLRAAHRPLCAFIEETCRAPLQFTPGTRVSYQSMGTALLAEVVHQVSGTALRDFLRTEIFGPLGMRDTSLGWEAARRERIAAVRLPAEQEQTDWHWNSPYWLGFGAPWGGLITSPGDFARFCQVMLNRGALGDVRIVSPATVRIMTSNQLALMPQVPEEERRCRPWGLGWRLNWPGESATFGDLLGPRTYGHWGATGTLCWIDPDTEAFFLLFTTQPLEQDGRLYARLSNAIVAAFL